MKKMWSSIRHYLGVYQLFMSTSTAMALSFRTSFIMLICMDLFFYASSLLSVDFIYGHVTNIGVWNRDQLLFFISFMLGIDQLHMMILSENFWELSFMIRTGQLDFVLLKPTHSMFTAFFRYFRASSVFNGFVVWALMIYFGMRIQLQWFDWLMLPILLVLSFTLLACLELMVSTLMFWMTEGLGINFLRMQFQQLSRWPNFVYTSLPRRILTIAFPILLVGSAPVHFLIDKSSWQLMLGLIVAILVAGVCLRWLWDLGVGSYDSASS